LADGKPDFVVFSISNFVENMTTKERLEELERRVINLEMKLQTRLVQKNSSPLKARKTRQKGKSKSK